ncbi:acetyltransferase [Helicobacter sp. 11S03491-1]|uniref:acetyltransferase n=1 Tax=Helicobacter sp. 11S03491-1 TaxID=1476196 RepID=UPI000BA795BB|nr:acetyltransferase [Helicobacter sp. 11S03491-1]PAF43774.1 hypothetical protein BKH45_00460 [Helicobacter sp. 11S03491-1]
MKNIFFIGAGGFGSECYQYLSDVMATDKSIVFKGFLSTSNDLAPYGLESFFLGHYDDYDFQEDDYIVIAIGMPLARYRLYHLFKQRGVKFYNLISPKAFVTNTHNIGEGNIIAPFNSIAANVKIGIGNIVNGFCAIGHDCVIGNFNVINSHCGFGGFTSMGNGNYAGMGTMFFPKSKIGDNCKISGASVVFKRIKNNSIAFGNPAEVIGQNEFFNFNP